MQAFLNDKTLTITPPALRGVQRDHAARKIWEWYDIPVAEKERAVLDAIAASRESILRYDGAQYRKDRTISDEEQNRLATVLAAYKAMGGE